MFLLALLFISTHKVFCSESVPHVTTFEKFWMRVMSVCLWRRWWGVAAADAVRRCGDSSAGSLLERPDAQRQVRHDTSRFISDNFIIIIIWIPKRINRRKTRPTLLQTRFSLCVCVFGSAGWSRGLRRLSSVLVPAWWGSSDMQGWRPE